MYLFVAIWAPGGPFGGLSGPWLSRGALRTLIRSSIALYLPSPWVGCNREFNWVNLLIFGVCQNNSAKAKLMDDGTRENVKKSVNVFVS